jgi:hypothetical protein
MAFSDVKFDIKAQDKTAAAFSKVESGLNGLRKGAQIVGTGLAAMAAAGTAAFGIMARDVLKTGDEIHKLSSRLGISTEALSQLKHAADLSGVQFTTLSKALQQMIRVTSEGASGMKASADILAELGVDAQRLKNLRPEQMFEVLAEALRGVANDADRVRLAEKLFGARGTGVLAMMEDGAAGIQAMRQEANELGLTLSQQGANNIAAFNDSLTRLKGQFMGLTQTIVVEFTPQLTRLATWAKDNLPAAITSAINALGWFEKGWAALKVTGAAAVSLIAHGIENLLIGLRTLFAPLDLLFEGLKKLGAIDNNPFDILEDSVGEFRAAADLMTSDLTDDLMQITERQDLATKAVETYTASIGKTIDASNSATEEIIAATKAQEKQYNVAEDAFDDLFTTTIKGLGEMQSEYYNSFENMTEFQQAQVNQQSGAFDDFFVYTKEGAKDVNKAYNDGLAEQTYNTKEQLRAQTLEFGTFFDGLKLGFDDVQDWQLTWAEKGAYISTEFARNSKNAIQDTFFAVLKGDFEDIGDAWEALLDSMLWAFSDILAQMLVEWATKNIFSEIFNSFGEGFTSLGSLIGDFAVDMGDTLTGGLLSGASGVLSDIGAAITGTAAGAGAAAVGTTIALPVPGATGTVVGGGVSTMGGGAAAGAGFGAAAAVGVPIAGMIYALWKVFGEDPGINFGSYGGRFGLNDAGDFQLMYWNEPDIFSDARWEPFWDFQQGPSGENYAWGQGGANPEVVNAMNALLTPIFDYWEGVAKELGIDQFEFSPQALGSIQTVEEIPAYLDKLNLLIEQAFEKELGKNITVNVYGSVTQEEFITEVINAINTGGAYNLG